MNKNKTIPTETLKNIRKSVAPMDLDDDDNTSSSESDDVRVKMKDILKEKQPTTRDQLFFTKTEIDLCLSDFKRRDLKTKLPLKVRLQKLFGIYEPMSRSAFERQINQVYKCCLKSSRDRYELHIRRSKGLKVLTDLTQRAPTEFISIKNVIHLTWCMLCCIHHFQLRLRLCDGGLIAWKRKNDAENCLEVNYNLIKLFPVEYLRIAINSIITFYKEGRLWELKFAAIHMILQLLEVYKNGTEVIDDIIYTVELTLEVNIEAAQNIMDLATDILKKIKWVKFSETLLTKFFFMLVCGISPGLNKTINYKPLKKHTENCIRNIISNTGRTDLIKIICFTIKEIKKHFDKSEIVAVLGNLAAHAARKYKFKSTKLKLSTGPLPIVFDLLESDDRLIILGSLRIWQNLIDRNSNYRIFKTPVIFFEDCDYKIVKNECLREDKKFFKRKRHDIHDIAIKSFMICSDRTGLENSFKSIALTLVEIPCGYSAACFITVAMCLQEYAFNLTSKNLVRSHHLHAVVMSILTLICHIHKATVFYKYVNSVMERRSEWAPHLNPPLKSTYKYAQHHILWNKPDLFFEDYEARYGLWKCFRAITQVQELESPNGLFPPWVPVFITWKTANARKIVIKSIITFLTGMLEIIFLRIFILWYQNDFLFNLLPVGREARDIAKNMHEFSGRVVREKKKAFDEKIRERKNSIDTYFENEKPKRKVFLDYLLEVTNDENVAFTEHQLRQEVNTFVIAGSDTTATSICYIFTMLGLHQDLQEKVYNEIIDVLGLDRQPEPSDLPNFKYLERFIKETQRLFPLAGLIAREVEEDINLGEYVVPAGASVVFGFLHTHRNEKYWPNPFKFDPDRFLPEEVAKRHPCAYVPFSYGPRNCIGLRYAMMGLKSLLATTLRKYRIFTSYQKVEDIKLKAHLVLRPKDGYKVYIEHRT